MQQRRAQVVIVTGAGGDGVGRGVCDALAEQGAQLVMNDVNGDAVRAAAGRYPDALALQADVRTADGVDSMITAAIERFGRVDALVNNAGIGLARPAHLAEEDDFDRLFSLNVRGAWLASRAFARHRIAEGGGGSIVNISSVHATRTQNGYGIYAATKGAIEGLTRGMATELGPHGIRCNAVAPGAVLEERFAHRYGIDGDEIAWVRQVAAERQVIDRNVAAVDVGRMVAFLVSPEAWAVVGQTVTVDAGLTALLHDRRFTGDA